MIAMDDNTVNFAVSVVIPICNTNNNLRRCLDSVISQTMKSLEVILVNSCTDSQTVILCDEYAKKDSRISIINSKQCSIGLTCNEGIQVSHGEYIGFLYPSDWVEPEMYESLYSQACKNSADVIASFIYFDESDNNIVSNRQLADRSDLINKVVMDKSLVPEFYLVDAYFWGAIYKRSFLNINKIKFNMDGSRQPIANVGFVFLVFYHMSSIFFYRTLFYHYDRESNVSSLNSIETAYALVSEHKYINKQLIDRNIDYEYILLEMVKAFQDIIKIYNFSCKNISQKLEYLSSASALFKAYYPYIKKNNYLSADDKYTFKSIASHPVMYAIFDRNNLPIKIIKLFISAKFTKSVSYIRIFRFPLIFIKRTDDYATFNIIKIPIRRVKKLYKNGTTKIKYYYFMVPLTKIIYTKESIKLYFLGFRIKKIINIQAQISDISSRISKIPSPEEVLYYAGLAYTIAEVHTKTFLPFKNINKGSNIAIFATGPSIKFAPEVVNSRTIACNRAIDFFTTNEPDYIFAQDYRAVADFIDELLEKKKSKIFLGINIPKEWSHALIPYQLIGYENIFNYYVSKRVNKTSLRPELEYNTLVDFGTVVHSAMRFALYTNASTIYLLGCDTSQTGYFNKNVIQSTMPINGIINGYKQIKAFRDLNYPKTRIISINPIGLRGIFEDVYTERFIYENSDIDSKIVKIIEEI